MGGGQTEGGLEKRAFVFFTDSNTTVSEIGSEDTKRNSHCRRTKMLLTIHTHSCRGFVLQIAII